MLQVGVLYGTPFLNGCSGIPLILPLKTGCQGCYLYFMNKSIFLYNFKTIIHGECWCCHLIKEKKRGMGRVFMGFNDKKVRGRSGK